MGCNLYLSFIAQANKGHKGARFHSQRCPDKYVGFVKDNVGRRGGFARNVNACLCKRNDVARRVILILESPHIKEFEGEGAPRPACGYSGSRIRNCWRRIFGQRYDDCKLIIMNVIQFQCSLGFSPLQPLLRDHVFKAMFKGGVRQDFIDRVCKYKRDCDILILAVTKGVHDVVMPAIEPYVDLDVMHPASWRNKKRAGWVRKVVEQQLKAGTFLGESEKMKGAMSSC